MSYNQGFPFAGRAAVGARGSTLNGYFNLKVTAHELGHNYGLSHANLWRTTDGTVIGSGSNDEYGNPFDVMGGGRNSRYHFNAHYKRLLDWLTDANVQTVTNNGVYRIFAHDSSTPGGVSALKIRKNETNNYWIEFRQLVTDNSSAMNGAIISWDYLSQSFRETQLLDMTPDTSFDADDSPLLIGQNFYDSENRIRISVLGKGNTTPESLDVKVELNVGCSFSLGQTSENFPASGGEGNIPVNTQGGCRPQPTSNNSWLYATPTDGGTVRYIVAANYDSQPRTGTITVDGQTFTVQQGAATTSCVARPPGLVAWWRGEGNALDQTGVNNGTLINNITFGGGRVGGGFLGDYDSNIGLVEVPDSASLALNRSMTFEGWLKLDSYGGTVIERQGNFISPYTIWLFSSGELNFSIGYNSDGNGRGISTPEPLPLGQFFHFAATRDDATSQMKIYINGSLATQGTITERPVDLDSNDVKINVGNINGITDELSVYNRALTDAEIQAIYDAGTAATGAAGKCLSTSGGTPGTVKFSSATYSVNESASTATITVTRSGGTAAFSVNYATSAGTATAGDDYTATSGTLSFAANQTSKTFSVPVLDDAAVEGDEKVNIALSGPTGGASLGTPKMAVLTIADNDAPSTLAVSDVSVTEGNAGTVAASFSVSLNKASGQTVTVKYASVNVTATSGEDYQAASGTLTFAAGETTKTFNVTVNGDSATEPDETFNVNLSGAVGATLADAQGVGTILNDDGAVYDATLKAPKCGQPGSVCDSGTLLNGRDHMFDGGEELNQPNTINNSCADDPGGSYHYDESIDQIKVSTLDGGDFTPGKTVQIEVTVWAYLGYMSDHLDLYYAANASSPSWVYIGRLEPAAAGSQVLSTTYTLPTGGNLQAVRAHFGYTEEVSPCGAGRLDDHDDLIFAVLRPTVEKVVWTNPVGVAPSANSISKNSTSAGWNAGAFSSKSITSGNGYVEFTADATNTTRACGLSRGNTDQSLADIDFAIYLGNGSARVYEKGVPKGSYVAYAVGNKFRVSIEGGQIKYRKNGVVFYISVLSPTYPLLADASLNTTGSAISNAMISGLLKTGPPEPGVTTNAASAITYTSAKVAGLVNPNGSATSVWFEWGLSPSLTGSTSTAEQNIGAGSTGSLLNTVLNNLSPGKTYYFRAAASNSGGTSKGSILNFSTTAAALPSLKVNNVSVTEATGTSATALFTVSLYPASSQAVTVQYATANVSAAAPADYQARALNTLTFSPGQTSQTVYVVVVGDAFDEQNETFRLLLSNPTGATIASGTGTCTILDNDLPPRVTINNVTATEPDTGVAYMTFTVRLSARSGRNISVKYATSDDTAAAGSDYTAVPLTTLIFQPGQSSKTFRVAVRGDTAAEPNETLFVNLSAPVNATIADTQGLGTITNDD